MLLKEANNFLTVSFPTKYIFEAISKSGLQRGRSARNTQREAKGWNRTRRGVKEREGENRSSSRGRRSHLRAGKRFPLSMRYNGVISR